MSRRLTAFRHHGCLRQLANRRSMEQRQKQLTAARGRLESYKKAHSVFLYEPEYEAKLKVISELEVALAKAEEALVSSQSTPSTVSLAARRARLIRSLDDQKADLIPLPGIERELKQLELDVKTADAAYQIVDKEFQEADIKNSYTMPELGLVSEAIAPRLPSSPHRLYIALASLVAGLVVGLNLDPSAVRHRSASRRLPLSPRPSSARSSSLPSCPSRCSDSTGADEFAWTEAPCSDGRIERVLVGVGNRKLADYLPLR